MKKALAAIALVAVGVAAGAGVTLLVVDRDNTLEGEPPTSEQVDTAATGQGVQGGCDRDDTSGCVPGAEIVITDSQWRCREPLADLAREAGGTLPLKVTARFTTYVETSGPVIDLREGCTGDGTDAIDLIVDVQGDGRTRGGVNDGMSVKLDAHDIDVTGHIDCGPRVSGSHQDGIQAQGARNITFVDLEIGDWDEQRSTCTGASGGIDISLGGIAGVVPTGHACIRCRVIACRRGINLGVSRGVRVVDSFFRSGNPDEREEALATGETGLCSFAVSTCSVEPDARDSVFERNVCDEYPYESSAAAAAAARGSPAAAS
jgi:hypothetical protein